MQKIVITTSSAKHFGLNSANAVFGRFSGGEVSLRIEDEVGGKELFIVGSTNAPAENIIELFFAIDTLNRLGAEKINIIIPYFAYSRADKEKFPGDSVSAETIAKIINTLGKNDSKVFSFDMHSPRDFEFFKIPFENVNTTSIFSDKFSNPSDFVVIAPDRGATARAQDLAKAIGSKNVSVLAKERQKDGSVVIKGIEGEVGKRVVVIDDIIDSGETILKGCEFLKERGASEIYVCSTHMVWKGGGYKKLADSDLIEKIFTTDTISPPENLPAKIEVTSILPMLEKIIYG
ncbi:MAG TPA: ribose-phosphate diphosphokinase [Patescibacteria group bacterium]|nr:ribose-phosphate diphosphokinase [Patescibacteria group bacterium]